MAQSVLPTSYRDLLAVPGFGRLAAASLLARVGGQMWGVGVVLYVLQLFHSPQLAGITVLVSLLPGLVLAPLAGAALDRWGRIRLICVDYGVGAATLVLMVLMAAARVLTPVTLLALMAVSSLTVPLGFAGARSLFPLLTPSHLWDRANAIDSVLFSASSVAGPALAGLLFAFAGGGWTMVVIAGTWLAAIGAILRVPEPARRPSQHHVLREAWHGLRETFANPVLRAMSIAFPLANASRGVLVLAVPVFVLRDLHGGPELVGYAWAAQGLAALLSGVAAGRLATAGRERRIMIGSQFVQAAAILLLALAPNEAVLFAAFFLLGTVLGPQDVAIYGLRQRSVDPGLLGRVLAISMSVNFVGQPLGSGLGGALVAVSARSGFAVAAGLLAVAAVLLSLLLGRRQTTAR